MIVDHLHLEQEGKIIKVMYGKELINAFNIRGCGKLNIEDDALRGKIAQKPIQTNIEYSVNQAASTIPQMPTDAIVADEFAPIEKIEQDIPTLTVLPSEVTAFVQAYTNMIYKYSKITRRYSSRPNADGSVNKNWRSLSAAAAQCKSFDIDAVTYLTILFRKYSQMNKSSKVSFPYPNQLHGDFANEVITEYLINERGEVSPEIKASKYANTNQRLSLQKDDLYQTCLAKFKKNTYDAFELEYVRLRQIQAFAEPLEWFEKFATRLKERTNGK